jgi:hypothetical protein
MRNIIIVLLVVLVACNSQKKGSFKPDFINAPPTIIYKTKANYNNLLPIILSDDKSEVISYPHPSDITVGNALALPTALKNGYLLDNRGIGRNVAFIKLTYKEYSKLENAPSLKELFESIVEKDPIVEMWNCGNAKAFSNKEKQINEIISTKKLETIFKRIK